VKNKFRIGAAFRQGWSTFKDDPGALIGGFFLWTVLDLLARIIPIFSIVYVLFIRPGFLGGLYHLLIRASRRTGPRVGNVFGGFQRYGSFLGIYWAFILLFLVSAIPTVLAVVIVENRWFLSEIQVPIALGRWIDEVFLFVVVAVSAITYVFLLIRWQLAWFFVADSGDNAGLAFRKSALITRGTRLKLAYMLLLSILVGLSGLLLFGIGIFITAPIAWCAVANAYMQLADRRFLASDTNEASPAEASNVPIMRVPDDCKTSQTSQETNCTEQESATSNVPPWSGIGA